MCSNSFLDPELLGPVQTVAWHVTTRSLTAAHHNSLKLFLPQCKDVHISPILDKIQEICWEISSSGMDLIEVLTSTRHSSVWNPGVVLMLRWSAAASSCFQAKASWASLTRRRKVYTGKWNAFIGEQIFICKIHTLSPCGHHHRDWSSPGSSFQFNPILEFNPLPSCRQVFRVNVL